MAELMQPVVVKIGNVKKLLLVLLAVVALLAGSTAVRCLLLPPAVRAQTNTFCAGNLACQVTAPWTFGNLNNIRIVDGTKFAQSAAGINAADTDLGTPTGEIWVPPTTNGLTATDAQITVGYGHTLRVFGSLIIDPVNKGPILLGRYSKLACSSQGGNGVGNFNTNIINGASSGTATSLVRATVQDGSLETFFIEGCGFNGNTQNFSRGLVDLTGMNDKGRFTNSIVDNFASGFGIYMDENNQGGSALGSSMSLVQDVWVTPGSGSGGCWKVSHNATNSVILQDFQWENMECQLAGGSSTIATAPIIYQNTSAGGGNLRAMWAHNWMIQGVPSGQPSILINGLQSSTFKDIICGGASTTCFSVSNNAVTTGVTFENIQLLAGTNSIADNVASPAITITNPVTSHYEVWLSSAPTQQIFRPNVQTQLDRIANGAGFQFFNTTTTCTTGSSIGNSCTTANITLPATEADTSYRAVCTGRSPTNFPAIVGVTNVDTSHITISIATVTAAAASFASYDCFVGHN